MPGQLHLFRGKKQRGTRAPRATEFALHVAIADVIRRWIEPGWRFTHLPLGELRDKITAARLKRMGTTPGWPDLMFFRDDGRVCFLELKRKGGALSEAQAELATFLHAAGHGFEITDDFKKAIEILKGWGVVRAGVAVQ
jgi:hypothetical protein